MSTFFGYIFLFAECLWAIIFLGITLYFSVMFAHAFIYDSRNAYLRWKKGYKDHC